MKTVAITGGDGLLGHELVRQFSRRGWNVLALSREELDVTNLKSIKTVLEKIQPDLLINCAVILDVDKCEADQSSCYAVNRDGVNNLLSAIHNLNLHPTFIQLSSSETFGRVNDGEYDPNGYAEDDIQKPVSAYQKSKKEGEDALLRFTKEHPTALSKWFIVRAGWLYGAGRETFVDRFYTLLQSKTPLTVIKDQWRSPTWTKDFAEGLLELLNSSFSSGIYHITDEVSPGEATTADVIAVIEEYLGTRSAHPEKKMVVFKDFFKVPRAPSNVLKNTKLPKLPYWRDSLRAYLKEKYPN